MSDWTPPREGPTKDWGWAHDGYDTWTAEVHDEAYDGSCEHWEYDSVWGDVKLSMGDLVLEWATDTLPLGEAVTRLRAAAAAFDRGEA